MRYRIVVDGKIKEAFPEKMDHSRVRPYFETHDFVGADMARDVDGVYEWRFKSRRQQPETHPDGDFKPIL